MIGIVNLEDIVNQCIKFGSTIEISFINILSNAGIVALFYNSVPEIPQDLKGARGIKTIILGGISKDDVSDIDSANILNSAFLTSALEQITGMTISCGKNHFESLETCLMIERDIRRDLKKQLSQRMGELSCQAQQILSKIPKYNHLAELVLKDTYSWIPDDGSWIFKSKLARQIVLYKPEYEAELKRLNVPYYPKPDKELFSRLADLGLEFKDLVGSHMIFQAILLDLVMKEIINIANIKVDAKKISYVLWPRYMEPKLNRTTIATTTYSGDNISLINLEAKKVSNDDFNKLKSLIHAIKPKIEGYEILDLIGEGSYKKTYRAKHISFDQDVALKIIDIPVLAQQPNVQRAIKTKLGENSGEDAEKALIKIFQEEARIMFKATTRRSANVSIIFEARYDPTTKQYRIVEELGDNTLADILSKEIILKPEAVYYKIKHILYGLAQLHKLNFVHGDLKPENILVNQDGSVRITDFGWSSQIPLLSQNYKDSRYLTNLLTSAPEVFDGKHPTRESDWWSLGIIEYRMLIGEWPFHHGFTGTEQEWRALPLAEKQKHAGKIREQMSEERIKDIQKRLNRMRFITRSDDTRVVLTPQKLLCLDPARRYPIDKFQSLAYDELT